MPFFLVEATYRWVPGDRSTGPISLIRFTHRRQAAGDPWQGSPTRLDQLRPFGRWRLRIPNGDQWPSGDAIDPAAYPGLYAGEEEAGQRRLDLGWLTDVLFVVTYEASVDYRFAG